MSTWDDTLVPVIKQLSEAYNKEHPNVTVKPQLTTWSEYWTKLEASATGGSAPDIMEMNILHVEEYVEGGILMDLTEAEEKSNLEIHENFPEQLVNGYIIDDKLYGIPKDFDTNGVFYNKKIFDEAGVAYPEDNWTFEDFRKKCEELKNAGLPEGTYAFASERGAAQSTYDATVFANGGYFLSGGNKKSGWAEQATIDGVQPWVDLVTDGISPTVEQMSDVVPDDMFTGGKLAMHMTGNYMISKFTDALGEGTFGVVKRPTFNGKDTDIINGCAYAVSAKTKHPEEAKDFVLWLGSEEAQKIHGEAGVWISARNDCQKYFVEVNDHLNCQIFLESAKNAELLPHSNI